MKLVETSLGYEIEMPNFLIHFGGLNSQLPQIQSAHPQYEFLRVKQIHSDAVVESTSVSDDLQVIADAHYTTKKGLALCVITADCVPAFIYDPKRKVVAGIHAGWRGVASRIIPKVVSQLTEQGSEVKDLEVFIGPHIQKNSFEVEYEVRDQILSSLGVLSAEEKCSLTEKISDQKALVDLNKVVHMQILREGVLSENISSFPIDTVTDLRFHSYRRDKVKSGRQVSFIVLR